MMANILQCLVGKTPYHCKNSAQFASQVSEEKVEQDEEFISADVTALFTIVPIDRALIVLRNRLDEDGTWRKKTKLEADDVITLTSLCLNCTYFMFDNNYYKQIHRAATGSPLSPIIINLYMENHEAKTLMAMAHPPKFYTRYVDDIFLIVKKIQKTNTIEEMNKTDENIKFTIVEEKEQYKIPNKLLQDDSEELLPAYDNPKELANQSLMKVLTLSYQKWSIKVLCTRSHPHMAH